MALVAEVSVPSYPMQTDRKGVEGCSHSLLLRAGGFSVPALALRLLHDHDLLAKPCDLFYEPLLCR